MFKNNEKSENIVDLHQDLLEAWNDVKNGKLSTESLKGLNGAINQMIKAATFHVLFVEKYRDSRIDKRIYDFLKGGENIVKLDNLNNFKKLRAGLKKEE